MFFFKRIKYCVSFEHVFNASNMFKQYYNKTYLKHCLFSKIKKWLTGKRSDSTIEIIDKTNLL